MSLSRLETIYSWINRIDSNTKTVIIIVLTMLCLGVGFKDYTHLILKDYTKVVQQEKELAEEYTKMITPFVNSNIEAILREDRDAYNVILLNYHNTLTSTHGLSYRFLTALTERRRGLETKTAIRYWKELEWMNYGDEIERINENGFLRMDSISKYEKTFPSLVDLLQRSSAKSAAFYPIMGIDNPVGMVILIYHEEKKYYLGYYNSVISEYIQPLATLLDYKSVKEKFEKAYESGQATPERLLQ